MSHRTIYLELCHKFLPQVVEGTCRDLEGTAFEAIAFRGISGAMVAPAVAYKLGKQLMCIRKTSDQAHTTYIAEGPLTESRYVIIDDQISSGATVLAIRDAIQSELNPAHKCVGIYLYNRPPSYFECWDAAKPLVFADIPILVRSWETPNAA